jgi:predicted RecA/RadA family phage recombinase
MAEAIFVREAETVRWTTLAALTSGQILRHSDGRVVVVAGLKGFAIGETAEGYAEGTFDVLSASATTFAAGAPVYWDETASLAIAAPNTYDDLYLGVATEAKVAGQLSVRTTLNVPMGTLREMIYHYTAGATLTAGMTGTTHTNLGASGAITFVLPQSPAAGTLLKFVCMADQALRVAPGAAGGIYVAGAKQVDNKYVSMTDIGDFIHLIADGNGDWVAVASIGGADADISVEA